MTTATLLQNGKQQFADANGKPLASGSVYFYIPNTNTLKSTWQDAGETILNTNPIILDAGGRAIIYGSGQYRQVVYDASGNLIWDQLTQDVLSFFGNVAYLNIGANLENDGAGNLVSRITTSQNIAAASITDLGSITTDVINVTGNTTITSFGSSANIANPIYFLTFGGTPLLTYNAVSLILPSSANIQAAAGDTALAQYLGSGNWKIISYTPLTGQPIAKSKTISYSLQTFSVTGTYTPTAGMIYCQVWAVGGGGGGGNAGSGGGVAACGAGGGAGGFMFGNFTAAQIGASQVVTIGAAGAGGSPGVNGGTTSLGTLLSMGGGTGGIHSAAVGTLTQGGRGGSVFTSSGGQQFGVPGNDGTNGFSTGVVGIAGNGGGSFFGGGGAGFAGQGNGFAGLGYGSGGGGASVTGVASTSGGTGVAGFLQILEVIYS